MTASFDDVAALIRRRRTNLSIDLARPVPDEVVEALAELVSWAPNHKRTWPWQMAWVVGDGRRRLGEVAATAMHERGDDPAKVAKTRTKYLRAPGTLVVGSAEGESALRTAENRDAVAAGVQNLLLGATAAGLASFWSSCPKGANDVVAEICGFAPRTDVTALIYLGWPLRDAEIPERPPFAVRRVAH